MSNVILFKFHTSQPENESFQLSHLQNLLKDKFRNKFKFSRQFFKNISLFKTIETDERIYFSTISKDEKYFFLSGHDYPLYDGQSFEKINSFRVNYPLKRAVFTNDGKYLIASQHSDHKILIWKMYPVPDSNVIGSLEGHQSTIWVLAINNDDKLLASGDYSGNIYLWNMQNLKNITSINGHNKAINGLCFSNDDKFVISGSWDHSIKIWSLENYSCIITLNGHTNLVLYCIPTKFNDWIVSSSYDRTIRIWNYKTGKCVNILRGHEYPVEEMCLLGDDEFLISVDHCGYIKVWDFQIGKEIHSWKAHNSETWSICMRKNYILSASTDSMVKIWK